jgi:hypothetical protein
MTPAKTPKKTTTKKRQPSKPIRELPPNPFAYEVLGLISEQTTTPKKIQVLQQHEHDSLKALFIWNFDDSVISLLPPGEVPYSSMKDEQNTTGTLSTRINQAVDTMDHNKSDALGSADSLKQGRTSLRNEWTKLYNFIKGGNDTLNGLRRETMFIQILEGLHPLDAELLCLVKDKKLTDKYKVTLANIKAAYPDITWGNRS